MIRDKQTCVLPANSASTPRVAHQVLNQPDHEFLLAWIAFGNQQGEGHQGVICKARTAFIRTVKIVGLHVEQKQKRADAFIAIGKGVILDDKIKEMGGASLSRGVEQLAVKGLVDVAQDAVQGVVAFAAEQVSRLTLVHQSSLELTDGLAHGGCFQFGLMRLSARIVQAAFVIGQQQLPGAGVVPDQVRDGCTFGLDQLVLGHGFVHQPHELVHVRAQLGEALMVEGIALDKVLFQGLGGPLAELHAAGI